MSNLDNVKIVLNAGYMANNKIGEATPTELFDMIKSEKYGSDLLKENRPTISQSFKNARPVNDNLGYLSWNGLQPIDIDIKHKVVAPIAKKVLEKLIYKYPWVHSIALSTSKNGLHIYTYTEPISVSDDPADESISSALMREYYLDCFEYKMMVIWKALMITHEILLKLDVDPAIAKKVHPLIHDNPEDVLDVTSARISQPLIITADNTVTYNENFVYEDIFLPDVLAIYANVGPEYKMDELRKAFDRIRNRYGVELVNGIVKYSDNHEFDDSFKDKIEFVESDLKEMYGQLSPMHYDNTQRYRMAYTLAYIFDIKERDSERYKSVESMFLKLCSGNPKYNREKFQYMNVFKSAVDRNIQGNCPCIWSAVKELREVHSFNISININQEEVKEQINNANTNDLITDFILNPVVYNEFFKLNPTHIFNIENNQYIGTFKDKLMSVIQHGVNLLDAPPGFGKTEFIKGISKENRVMLVLPYTSIISSKIETSDLGFECFYGDRPTELGKHKNVALTYDKFANIDIDEVSMLFDVVAIDESHLLTMSAYRGTVPADVVDKVNSLKTKVVLMTGTTVSEHLFMNLKTVIQFKRPNTTRNKHLNFVICQSNGDKLTKIAIHISNAIKAGKKILFPTNKGNEYTERIQASVRVFLGRTLNYKYYKRDNHLADFVDNVNLDGTIGDVDLLFCSNYLSVGVDINDLQKFDVIYDEQFTAQEIEQFNCRLRKLDIESYYYFSKVDSQGMPKNITLYDDLSLDLTTDEALSFTDIKNLHLQSNNTEVALFDFFRYADSAPYFIKDRVSGEVHVHNMCFRLHKFEEKWRAWAIQLNVVATFLTQYGYTCDVLQDISETDEQIKITIEASKEAASEYRQMKQDHTSQLLNLALSDDKTFNWMLDLKMEDIVDSDGFSIVRRKDRAVLLCADQTIFKTWRRIFRILSRYYIRETIEDIIKHYCFDKDHYNITASNRIVDALRVIQNTEDETLVESNIYIVDKIINNVFKGDLEHIEVLEKEDVGFLCQSITEIYLKTSATYAKSVGFKMQIEKLALRIFKALTVKETKNTYRLVELPAFDAPQALQKNKTLHTIMSLFGESANDMNAMIVKNELGRALSNSVKDIMGSKDIIDDGEKHVILGNDALKIATANLDNKSMIDDLREIIDTDYKYIKVIKQQQEVAETIAEMNVFISEHDENEDMPTDLADALNAALDDIFG